MWRLTEDEFNDLQEKIRATSKNRSSGKNLANKSNPSSSAKKTIKDEEGRQEEDQRCIRIVIIARRCRDIDPDNIWPKWFIDEIVRAGIIKEDSSRYIEGIYKTVEKVSREEDESTIIELWKVKKE